MDSKIRLALATQKYVAQSQKQVEYETLSHSCDDKH